MPLNTSNTSIEATSGIDNTPATRRLLYKLVTELLEIFLKIKVNNFIV